MLCDLLLVLSLLALFALGLVVFPDSSLNNFLSDYISDRLHKTGGYTFRLFTNNHTPSSASLLTDFTEATFTGYNAIPGSNQTWGAPAVAGHISQTTSNNFVWNNTGGSTVQVYGVFVTDFGTPTLLYLAERDPNAPVSIPAGGSYLYTGNVQFKSIN